jgi:hypothetical protein
MVLQKSTDISQTSYSEEKLKAPRDVLPRQKPQRLAHLFLAPIFRFNCSDGGKQNPNCAAKCDAAPSLSRLLRAISAKFTLAVERFGQPFSSRDQGPISALRRCLHSQNFLAICDVLGAFTGLWRSVMLDLLALHSG